MKLDKRQRKVNQTKYENNYQDAKSSFLSLANPKKTMNTTF